MQKRASSKISIELLSHSKKINAQINQDLFEWVIENIIKNSMDAISQSGKIVLTVLEQDKAVYVDVMDNGRGVKKSFFKEIFEPGFTSKKRGWGLGLSLVRRIIKDYHGGHVSLLKSVPNKETIVRIVLKK